MKKAIVMLMLAISIASAASAQESKAKKFELGISFDRASYLNYSALSLFQDAQNSYSAPRVSCHFGYQLKNEMIGLKFGINSFNTSAITLNEKATVGEFCLMDRHYEKINEHWETFFGVFLGLTGYGNSFTYLGSNYNRNRWMINCGVEIGINYLFEKTGYLGIRASYNNASAQISKSVDLPTGLVANEKKNLDGFTLSIQYGFRF